MIKDFLGIEFRRFGESARLWFSNKEVARGLGIGSYPLRSKLSVSPAGPFRAIAPSLDDLRLTNFAEARREYRDHHLLFEVDYLLAAAFNMSTPKARDIREWVSQTINGLCFDGFVSLNGYQCSVEVRCAITARVCGTASYLEIVRERFDPEASNKGTNLAPLKITLEDLLNPDNYLTRAEITRIKALDLCVHLLSQHFEVNSLELLKLCGIATIEENPTEAELDILRVWVSDSFTPAQ